MTFLKTVGSESAASDHGVRTADADGLGGDQHLAVGGSRGREVDDGQTFWTPEGLDRDCLQCRLLVVGIGRNRPDATVGGGPSRLR
jgi:hypothetical protein